MSLLTISNLRKDYGAQRVLDGVNLRVARGEKIGIVGKNGGGKTTLLKLLLGQETPDGGSVHVARGVRVGYLAQVAVMDAGRTLREEAETALVAVKDAEAHLRETEVILAERPDDEDALDAYAAARDGYEFLGAERALDSLDNALSAMGFSDADQNKLVSVLSGGEKTRLALAKLLVSAPDVLLLDEPTNHLDIRAVEWLEGFLGRFPGAVVVVSHDRRLLSAVARTIWEVEAGGVTVYGDGFDSFRQQREAARARQQEEYERQQAEIEKLEAFVRKNKEGNLSRQAKSREKTLARMERIEAPVHDPKAMKAKLDTSGRSGRTWSWSRRPARRSTAKNCWTTPRSCPARRARGRGRAKRNRQNDLCGDGAGRGAAGPGRDPARLQRFGRLRQAGGRRLRPGPERAGKLLRARRHDDCGGPRASGEVLVFRRGRVQAGQRAQRRRARQISTCPDGAVARQPARFGRADQPSGHLLVRCACRIPPALSRHAAFGSHDRALLDAVTGKTLAFEGHGRVRLFDGPYHAYRDAALAESEAAAAKAIPAAGRNGSNGTGKNALAGSSAPAPTILNAHQLSKERQRAAKRVATLEAEVESLEAQIASVEAGLSAPASPDDGACFVAAAYGLERRPERRAFRLGSGHAGSRGARRGIAAARAVKAHARGLQ
jgi:ATP-binding cassette subfamily F protein 3